MRKATTSILLLVLTLLVLNVGMAAAGGFYVYDKSDEYWWYVQEKEYEVLVPSDGDAYLEHNFMGTRSLSIAFKSGVDSVLMRIVEVPAGSDEEIWEAVLNQYTYLARSWDTLVSRDITTSEGLAARFYVAELKATAGGSYMIRCVIFRHKDRRAFLVLELPTGAYRDSAKRKWIEAVNSFAWRE